MAMENIKFRDMKKLFLFILLISCISSCQDKNSKIIKKTKEMEEKFDIVKYNKEIENKEKLNDINLSLSDYQEKNEDGTIIEYHSLMINDYNKAAYNKYIYPPVPAIYFEVFEYDEKGNFLSKHTQFFGNCIGYDAIRAGKSYYFNKNNTVTEVDEDRKYDNIKIKPNMLFEILKREPLFVSVPENEREYLGEIFQMNPKDITVETLCKVIERRFLYEPQTNAGRENIAVRLEDNETWFIMKDLYPLGQVFLQIDANTGKISTREYKRDMRP
jgi:hypothetical protein